MISILSIVYCGIILAMLAYRIRKGLQAFIFTFPFVQTYMNIDLGGSLKFRLSALISILLILYILFRAIQSKKFASEIKNMKLNRTILTFCAILFISILLNPNIFEANFSKYLYYILRNICLIYVGWLSFNNLKDGIDMNRKLLTGVSILAIYGLFEIIVQSNPVLDYFATQFSASSLSDEFSPILRYESDSRGYRVQSIFYHPYPWGGILASLSLFPLYFLFQRTFGKGSWKYLAIYVIFLANIILTRGRSTLLPALFVLGTAFLFSKGKIQGKASMLMAGICVLALLLVFFPALWDQLLPYFSFSEENGGLKGSSTDMRLKQFMYAMSTVEKNIWGGNGFEYVKSLLLVVGLDGDLQGAESFWLVSLIETGLIGVIAYIFLFGNIIYYFFSIRRKCDGYPRVQTVLTFIQIGIVGYVIFISTTGTMNTLPFFFVMVGVMAKYAHLSLIQIKMASQVKRPRYTPELHPIS